MSKEITINDLSLENSAGFRNLIAIRDFSKGTRAEVRRLEQIIKNNENQLVQLNNKITMLEAQLQTLYNRLL
jgi:hypothetical protein